MSTRMLMGGAWLVGVLALLPGCTPAQSTCGQEQEARITSFVAELSAVIQTSGIPLPNDVELPRIATEDAPFPVEGILVVLDREGLVLGGQREPRWHTSDRLYDEVLRSEALAEATGRAAEPVLVAAIAADVPARDVKRLLELAEHAGLARVAFVAEAASGPPIPAIPEPELPAMIRERTGGDPSRELEVIAQLLDAEVERCPPLGEGPEHVPMASRQSRAPAILEATKDALLACQCRANVERVLSLAHVFVAPTRATVLSADLSFDRVAPLVAAHADARWSDVAPSIFGLAPDVTPTITPKGAPHAQAAAVPDPPSSE